MKYVRPTYCRYCARIWKTYEIANKPQNAAFFKKAVENVM